jgi:protein-export SecD/SecF family membrane protein
VDYRRIEVVGPRVSGELLYKGILGLFAAIAAILVYLWFRFEWQFALGAMIANVHDIVLTLGFMSVTQIDFDLTSIAALLTILGYSLNDTVVIYDRIREMLRRYKRLSMPDLLNVSINSTLSRSIITHVTVAMSLLALLLFGGPAIHSFTATMMFGVVLVGTYTSVFIASPILIYLGVGTGRTEHACQGAAADARQGAALIEVTEDQAQRPHLPRAAPIDAYGKGGFRFADLSHRGSLLCLPNGIWASPVSNPAEITEAALALVFANAQAIDHCLIGTGIDMVPLASGLRETFRAHKIVAETMATGAAVRTYNILLGERRRVAALLIAVP